MTEKKISSKGQSWLHFSSLTDSDVEFLLEHYRLHHLHFENVRDHDDLTKLDVYKYYLFSTINLPYFNEETGRIEQVSLYIFLGKDYLVTASVHPIPVVERYFARIRKSAGSKRKFFGGGSEFMLYLLLDEVYSDARNALRELVKETQLVEHDIYDTNARVTTARLGVLRRNIMLFGHVLKPSALYLDQLQSTRSTLMPKAMHIYLEDVRDTLDAMLVVADNLKATVDSLFDVNEAFLSHRTNEIIRTLTIISVLLMPPTLITSFYGMNIEALPLHRNMPLVLLIIALSIAGFWFFIRKIDRK